MRGGEERRKTGDTAKRRVFQQKTRPRVVSHIYARPLCHQISAVLQKTTSASRSGDMAFQPAVNERPRDEEGRGNEKTARKMKQRKTKLRYKQNNKGARIEEEVKNV